MEPCANREAKKLEDSELNDYSKDTVYVVFAIKRLIMIVSTKATHCKSVSNAKIDRSTS